MTHLQTMTRLQTQNLQLSYPQASRQAGALRHIIHDLSLDIADGEITVFIGANGCGKSTLLKSLARLLKPTGGNVCLDGQPLTDWAATDIARQLAILPQSPVAPEEMTVLQLVKQGRYPHQRWFQQWSALDQQKVEWALELTHTTALMHQTVQSLSGGQRQRVWIAMTLAQDADILLLDEPTTYLDLNHQIELLDLLIMLNREHGKTIVMVLHDLNLACRYADQLVAVHQGGVCAQGKPAEIMTSGLLQQVFNLHADVLPDPFYGTPMIVPVSRHLKRNPALSANTLSLESAPSSHTIQPTPRSGANAKIAGLTPVDSAISTTGTTSLDTRESMTTAA
ncbi:MAG: ABC transporter ATP-binding protein [Plesiomonas sp.]|uniref:ABC transporter ATP-binding protein n=1 Tax=Plesiomonas sp. TaxID=2486279 RepID=UPI003F33751E